MKTVAATYFSSPIGILEIKSTDLGISSVLFTQENNFTENFPIPDLHLECISQLVEYFSGVRKKFSLPLDIQGTDFQRHVWCELQKIPFGSTASYLEIAERVGDKNAIRAVGNANGQNKISIIIPCHRVIGSNGKLTGYAGGLHRKEWLINFEKPDGQENLF